MDHNEVALCAEEVRQTHAALRRGEFVVADFLGRGGGADGAHLAPQLRDAAPMLGERVGSVISHIRRDAAPRPADRTSPSPGGRAA
jgi:hypothetical protein